VSDGIAVVAVVVAALGMFVVVPGIVSEATPGSWSAVAVVVVRGAVEVPDIEVVGDAVVAVVVACTDSSVGLGRWVLSWGNFAAVVHHKIASVLRSSSNGLVVGQHIADEVQPCVALDRCV
jgi:uncharacterized protein with von Willebrand factor type A (vWA) domain